MAQPHFRFLALPAEIRNSVYRLVANDTIYMRINQRVSYMWIHSVHMAITQTNRQIRTESLQLLREAATEAARQNVYLLITTLGPHDISILPVIGEYVRTLPGLAIKLLVLTMDEIALSGSRKPQHVVVIAGVGDAGMPVKWTVRR